MQIDSRQFFDVFPRPLPGDSVVIHDDTESSLIPSVKSDKPVNFSSSKPVQGDSASSLKQQPKINISAEQLKYFHKNPQVLEFIYGSVVLLNQQAGQHLFEDNNNLSSQLTKDEIKELIHIKNKTRAQVWYFSLVMYHLTYQSNPQQAATYLEKFKQKKIELSREDETYLLDGASLTVDKQTLASVNAESQVSAIWKWFSLREYRTNYFISMNWYRLGLVRLMQVVAATVTFFVAINMSHAQIIQMLSVLNVSLKIFTPALAWLSFCFYAPRLFVNFSLLLKHVFYTPSMNETQQQMTVSERFAVQWDRRKFQLLNDFIWFSDGLTVFVLSLTCSATLAVPLSLLLVAGLYIFDVWNAYDDLQKARSLEKQLLDYFANSPEAYKASAREFCKSRIANKEFTVKITAWLLLGKTPALIMGCVAMSMGLAVLSNPYILGLFFVASVLVLATHLAQRFLKADYKPQIKSDEMTLKAAISKVTEAYSIQVLAPPVKALTKEAVKSDEAKAAAIQVVSEECVEQPGEAKAEVLTEEFVQVGVSSSHVIPDPDLLVVSDSSQPLEDKPPAEIAPSSVDSVQNEAAHPVGRDDRGTAGLRVFDSSAAPVVPQDPVSATRLTA